MGNLWNAMTMGGVFWNWNWELEFGICNYVKVKKSPDL